VALQRERRKRRSDRRGRADDDRVIHLEGEDRDRDQKGQDGDQKGRDEDRDRDQKGRDQEDRDRDQKGQDQEDRDRDQEDRDQEDDQGRERRDRRPQPLPDMEVLEAAKDQLTVLTGRVAESVSGVRGSDNGWRMKIDLVELERIPPSTSLMATYAVELDREGNVVGYEQERRYLRGQADD
jgi:Gas vesicle synthesis protein GvpO